MGNRSITPVLSDVRITKIKARITGNEIGDYLWSKSLTCADCF